VQVADSITCTVTNDANPGTVTVSKDTNPEDGTGPFVVTLTGPNTFLQTKSLAGDGSSDSFTAVPADNPYNLAETLTGLPYTLESITCVNGQTVLDPASFRVLPGAAIQCTVTNDANPGHVIVTKDTNPEGGTGSFPITLTGPNAYSENGTLTNDGGQHTFDPVPVGSGYALSENLTRLQYNLTSIVCNGTDVTQTTFAVGPGETVNCTITNTAKTGTVIVTKRTDPSGGTGTFPVTLAGPRSFSDSGNLVDDGGQHTFSSVPFGSGYSLGEDTSGLDYKLGSIVCGGVDVTSGSFAVAADQTVECTVTNVRNPNPPPPPPPEPGGAGAGAGGTGGPSAPVLVTGRSTGALAFTGSSILVPLAAVAIGLIAVGGGLLLLRRRLRSA
jgi:large repetitive protein